MLKKFILIGIGLLSSTFVICGQTTFDETCANLSRLGGVYYPYPQPDSVVSKNPDGYQPFYVSHFARHGSRYLISDRDLDDVLQVFEQASESGALSKPGTDVLAVLRNFKVEMDGRGGELTPLGERQHRDIARRMYNHYPEVFASGAEVTAVSTPVMRCAYSMMAFTDVIKEYQPALRISRESSERTRRYLNHHSEASNEFNRAGALRDEFESYKSKWLSPDRLINTLFADSAFISDKIDKPALYSGLYWIACDLPNTEQNVELFSIFTKEELFDMWRLWNYDFYIHNASYPASKGLHLDNADKLISNILDTADSYISADKHGATLRFAHDGNIIPLVARLRLDGCYGYANNPDSVHTVWANWKISPMAANLQIIFFKNTDDDNDILVKFMLNENEIAIPVDTTQFPYYKWNDVREYLITTLATPAINYVPEEFYNRKESLNIK